MHKHWREIPVIGFRSDTDFLEDAQTYLQKSDSATSHHVVLPARSSQQQH